MLFALFMERAGVPAGMVIDINPAKQGKFLPVTGLRVQSPETALKALTPGTEIFVMNGNYLDEVRTLTGNRFHYVTVDHEDI